MLFIQKFSLATRVTEEPGTYSLSIYGPVPMGFVTISSAPVDTYPASVNRETLEKDLAISPTENGSVKTQSKV